MDSKLDLKEIYIGILTGWIVIIFSEPYFNIKKALFELFKDNIIARGVLEIALPTIGFLLIIFLIQLGAYIENNKN